MSPWIVVGIVAYWLVAFWVASRIGGFLRAPAPPAGPRARFVQERDRVGRVECLPALGDAENARRRSHTR